MAAAALTALAAQGRPSYAPRRSPVASPFNAPYLHPVALASTGVFGSHQKYSERQRLLRLPPGWPIVDPEASPAYQVPYNPAPCLYSSLLACQGAVGGCLLRVLHKQVEVGALRLEVAALGLTGQLAAYSFKAAAPTACGGASSGVSSTSPTRGGEVGVYLCTLPSLRMVRTPLRKTLLPVEQVAE